MAFGARILADSLSPDGVRLTSFEVTHPRYILAEVNTHRMLSRNSASSRAIPVATVLQRLKDDPYTPVYWGSNKRGMQAGEELDEATQKFCLDEWLAARDDAMAHAAKLRELGLHKQDANRLLEPFMWHTAIITATEWGNFFHLRNHPDAHPAFQTIAAMMQELHEEQIPRPLHYEDWHLPFIDFDDEVRHDNEQLIGIATGRCARVSMEKHEDDNVGIALRVHEKLLDKGHMSPLEHVARPATEDDSGICMAKLDDVLRVDAPHQEYKVWPHKQWHGNFRGWVQYRKTLPWEHDPLNPEARR